MCEVFQGAGHRAKGEEERGAGLRPGTSFLHNTMFQSRTQEVQEFIGLPDLQKDIICQSRKTGIFPLICKFVV